VKYAKAPTKEQGANLPPSMGLQFFGLVAIGNYLKLTVVTESLRSLEFVLHSDANTSQWMNAELGGAIEICEGVIAALASCVIRVLVGSHC
jgi:hypothetical protein